MIQSVKYLFNFILLVVCTQFAFADVPDWQDNPGGYQFVSFLVGGIVLNDGVQMGGDGDMFAAFDDAGNVRGVAVELSPPFGPYAGTPVFEMTMRSNSAGEILTFQYYDYSADEILDVSTTYTFVTNEQLGDMMAPFELIITSTVDLSIDLISGYNWISFNAVPEDVSLAGILGSLGTDANFVASQSDGVSNNYGDYGWYGSLVTLEPGSGYLLEMLAPGELVYPEFDGLARFSLNKQEVVLSGKLSDWNFNYADYRYVGAVTASIESRTDFAGDIVGVFVDDKCRGLAERMYFPFDDTYFYSIQVYSNIAEGEEMTFKYYDKANDEVVEYTETIEFTNNMVIGDGFNTMPLSRIARPTPEQYSLSDAYPNPFNPTTTLSFSVPTEGVMSLNIYDMTGRLVSTLVDGNLKQGYHSITWNGMDSNGHAVSSGMYIYSLKGEGVSITKKMVMMK